MKRPQRTLGLGPGGGHHRNKEKPHLLVCRLLFSLSIDYCLKMKYMNHITVIKSEALTTRINIIYVSVHTEQYTVIWYVYLLSYNTQINAPDYINTFGNHKMK